MKLTEAQRETAARLLAEQRGFTEWQDLRPFTRAQNRTAVLTMERIFRRALEQNEKEG